MSSVEEAHGYPVFLGLCYRIHETGIMIFSFYDYYQKKKNKTKQNWAWMFSSA